MRQPEPTRQAAWSWFRTVKWNYHPLSSHSKHNSKHIAISGIMWLFLLENDRFHASEIFKQSKHFLCHLHLSSHSQYSHFYYSELLHGNNLQLVHSLWFLTIASVLLNNMTVVIAFGMKEGTTPLNFTKHTTGLVHSLSKEIHQVALTS